MTTVKENYQTPSNTIYSSDLQPSSSKLTAADFHEIVRNKTGTHNFKLINYELIPVKENGFLGDYFKLRICYEIQGKKQTLHCFSKFIASANEVVKSISQNCFKKENFFYCIFIPVLNHLGFKELTSFAPACYFSRTNEVIVLEDLSLKGYSSSIISKPATVNYLLIVMKELVKLHACSILHEETLSRQTGKEVRLGDIYKEYLEEINFAHDQPDGQCMTFGAHNIYRYFIDKLTDVPGRLSREEFKEETKKHVRNLVCNLNESDRYRNVINHRDLWVSNVLMKKDEQENSTSCILLDFQLIKYCPPALDLLFLFYMNTDQETRKKHMLKCFKEYYQELEKILQNYQFNLAEIIPYESFLKSCEELKATSICQALAYSQILLLPSDMLREINNDEEKAATFYSKDRKEVLDRAWNYYQPLRVRITELLEELYQICEQNLKRL